MSDEKPPKLDPDRRTVIHRLESVKRLSRDQLDELPFGVIQLDRYGKVLAYNATEAKLADKSPDDVIGKNFFTEVAPCTNVQEFAGRFRDGITKGKIQDTFPYRFEFDKGPAHVMVTIHYEAPDEHAWIFVDEFQG